MRGHEVFVYRSPRFVCRLATRQPASRRLRCRQPHGLAQANRRGLRKGFRRPNCLQFCRFGRAGKANRQRPARPADIFFSADEAQMDAVATKGLLAPDSRHNLLGNSLAIVTAPDNSAIASATDLTNTGRATDCHRRNKNRPRRNLCQSVSGKDRLLVASPVQGRDVRKCARRPGRGGVRRCRMPASSIKPTPPFPEKS